MSIKTNKSYAKRLKVTRRGKVLARSTGQNHFNAKESRRAQLKKKRTSGVSFSAKARSRFLVNL